MGDGDLLELLIRQPIFIVPKADLNLQQRLEILSDAGRQYVSRQDSTFLRICRVGNDINVGKLIHENLTTDRVDDIGRNVLGILRKIGREVRLPINLKILACSADGARYVPAAG